MNRPLPKAIRHIPLKITPEIEAARRDFAAMIDRIPMDVPSGLRHTPQNLLDMFEKARSDYPGLEPLKDRFVQAALDAENGGKRDAVVKAKHVRRELKDKMMELRIFGSTEIDAMLKAVVESARSKQGAKR